LVAGIGNIFRGDDGFGSEVVRRLAGRPLPGGVRVVDYGIRGMHLAYDLLDGWDALILVDAVPDRGEPGRVAVLDIAEDDVTGGGFPGDAQVDAHGMDPVTVFTSLRALGGTLPPRTLLVGCQVRDAGEAMGLTPVVEAAVDPAVETVRALVDRVLDPTEVA
jgi:hydrogenase maturation protease